MTKADRIQAQINAEAERFCCPGFATPTWRLHYAKGAYAKGQRVMTHALRATDAGLGYEWREDATVTDPRPMAVSPTSGDWYCVRFDDGGELRVHETQLRSV